MADKVFYLACPDVCYENCLACVHRLMGPLLLYNLLNQYNIIALVLKESKIGHSFFRDKPFLSPQENQLVPWIRLSLFLFLCRLEVSGKGKRQREVDFRTNRRRSPNSGISILILNI